MDAPTEYVAASAVRSGTLSVVADEHPVGTAAVLEGADASQSAVYEALAGLEDRGHIAETDAGWLPTGTGRVVADVLDLAARADRALSDSDGYWESHRADTLPERFRRRLGALEGAEVLCAPDADPGRVVREVADHVRTAERIDVFAPVYHREYGDALSGVGDDARLLLAPSVLRDIDEESRGSAAETPFDVRIAPVKTGMAVSDDGLYLSAPQLDGGYDGRSELIDDSPAAIAWGRELFEARWERADPPEEFGP
jgi:predicted transcriptional regulator